LLLQGCGADCCCQQQQQLRAMPAVLCHPTGEAAATDVLWVWRLLLLMVLMLLLLLLLRALLQLLLSSCEGGHWQTAVQQWQCQQQQTP
jgi:hypothetical protein